METWLRIFRRQQPSGEHTGNQTERLRGYGFFILGGRVPIERKRVWVETFNDRIAGEIPSNLLGFIRTTHSPIILTIKPRVPFPESARSQNDQGLNMLGPKYRKESVLLKTQKICQVIGPGRDSLDKSIDGLVKSRSQAILDEQNFSKQITQLIGQLERLGAGQILEAQETLERFQKQEELLKARVKSLYSHIDREIENIPDPLDPTLRIESLNGDITLVVEDPGVLIVVPDKFNHRKKPIEIKGRPPKDSKREISVFTYRGRIVINYSSPEEESSAT